MGKMLERVCDHLFGDVSTGKKSDNTQNLSQNVKGQVSCQLVEMPNSLYNFAKENGEKEFKKGRMNINLDIGE